MDKRLRELEEEQRRLMEQMEKNESKNKYKYKSAEKHESNILLQFVIGLLLLGVGLFWIFQSVKVTSGFSSFYSIGGWSAPQRNSNNTAFNRNCNAVCHGKKDIRLDCNGYRDSNNTYSSYYKRQTSFQRRKFVKLCIDVWFYRCGRRTCIKVTI